MSEWISVKDRLPDSDGRYLVCRSITKSIKSIGVSKFTKNPYHVDKYDFSEYKGCKKPIFYEYDSEWGYCELDDVTHWMPLPELPKEE